ncbi:hypothetical protein F4779DRAFT_595448 [Xylariaceae sp. FL0662B]|nr:hypothetical protein F4779DRAFT_595448 [Xylariaceae sp. FL0662B]
MYVIYPILHYLAASHVTWAFGSHKYSLMHKLSFDETFDRHKRLIIQKLLVGLLPFLFPGPVFIAVHSRIRSSRIAPGHEWSYLREVCPFRSMYLLTIPH